MRTVSRHGPLKLLILILMHACKLRIHEATPANIELIGIYCVDGGWPSVLENKQLRSCSEGAFVSAALQLRTRRLPHWLGLQSRSSWASTG